MPIYNYKVKTMDGKTLKGTIESKDKTLAINTLRSKGYFLLSIEEQSLLQKDISLNFIEQIKLEDISVFCRQFATLVNAGITVLACLDILRQQTENKKLKNILQQVYEDVQKGSALSDALKKHKIFPVILLNMIEAGEASGTLDTTLERVAAHFEKEVKLNQKVKGALTYPIILVVIATAVIFILVTVVVPTFVGMFDSMGMELPFTTKMLLKFSDMVKKYWYLILGIFISIIMIVKFMSRTDEGRRKIDILKLKLPIFGPLNKKVISSQFTRTLSTLLASGLSLLISLEIVEKVVNNYIVTKGLEKTRDSISQGTGLAEPIEEIGVFPPMVTNMIKIGEDTGALESMLEKTAEFYDQEVETAISQLTTLLEPLIIVIMAVIVGFIVLSIVQPMVGMFQGIQL